MRIKALRLIGLKRCPGSVIYYSPRFSRLFQLQFLAQSEQSALLASSAELEPYALAIALDALHTRIEAQEAGGTASPVSPETMAELFSFEIDDRFDAIVSRRAHGSLSEFYAWQELIREPGQTTPLTEVCSHQWFLRGIGHSAVEADLIASQVPGHLLPEEALGCLVYSAIVNSISDGLSLPVACVLFDRKDMPAKASVLGVCPSMRLCHYHALFGSPDPTQALPANAAEFAAGRPARLPQFSKRRLADLAALTAFGFGIRSLSNADITLEGNFYYPEKSLRFKPEINVDYEAGIVIPAHLSMVEADAYMRMLCWPEDPEPLAILASKLLADLIRNLYWRNGFVPSVGSVEVPQSKDFKSCLSLVEKMLSSHGADETPSSDFNTGLLKCLTGGVNYLELEYSRLLGKYNHEAMCGIGALLDSLRDNTSQPELTIEKLLNSRPCNVQAASSEGNLVLRDTESLVLACISRASTAPAELSWRICRYRRDQLLREWVSLEHHPGKSCLASLFEAVREDFILDALRLGPEGDAPIELLRPILCRPNQASQF